MNTKHKDSGGTATNETWSADRIKELTLYSVSVAEA